jgi:hypothetical protein
MVLPQDVQEAYAATEMCSAATHEKGAAPISPEARHDLKDGVVLQQDMKEAYSVRLTKKEVCPPLYMTKAVSWSKA